jgi:hypothetical protein
VLRAAFMQLFNPGPPRANTPGSQAEVQDHPCAPTEERIMPLPAAFAHVRFGGNRGSILTRISHGAALPQRPKE